MKIRLPQDLEALRDELPLRFARRPVFAFVLDEILRRLDEEVWADEQGVPASTGSLIDSRLSPLLEEVRDAVEEAEIERAMDNLVQTWRSILPQVELA
jgi:hypothetical protein